MTPFGEKVRQLRAERSMTLKDMASGLGLSSAYLSAMEHGNRGRPSSGLVMQVCGLLNLDWDGEEDLKKLASLSHPRVTVDTAGLSPSATALANLLAENIGELDDDTLEWIIAEIQGRMGGGHGGGPAY